MTEVLYADGTAQSYRYRADGMLLEATNDTASVVFERDILGRVLTETQDSETIHIEYDPLGYRIGLSSSLGANVRYSRDAAGNIEQLQAGTWQAQFEHDAQGLEIYRTYSGGVQQRWKRDSMGRPTEPVVGLPAVGALLSGYAPTAGKPTTNSARLPTADTG